MNGLDLAKQGSVSVEVIYCAHCRMPLKSVAEFHPAGACLMFLACGIPGMVRRALEDIRGLNDVRRVIGELHEAMHEQKPGSLTMQMQAAMKEGARLCEAALLKRGCG